MGRFILYAALKKLKTVVSSTTGTSAALWRLLQAVTNLLMALRRGVTASASLDATPPDLRAGTQAIAFQVLRNLGRAEALCKLLAKRTPPPEVHALMCSVLALAWKDEDNPFDNFTLVNQAVESAKRTPALKASSNFVNACLRRFLRERDALVEQTSSELAAIWNHPAWWIKQLQREQPQRWQEVLLANSQHAPLTLRINQRKLTVDDYLMHLQNAGVDAHHNGNTSVTLTKARAVTSLPGFAQGSFAVQDSAAQLAAPLLMNGLIGNVPLRILDACAAPGGKTAHLLELADCQLTALDIDSKRCERIRETLGRLGLRAEVLVADAALPETWWNGIQFDGILLDAPCTASGIVRRHPDVRWLRRPSDVAALGQIQAKLLKALWLLVKPGGRLLYCTCSVFHAEGVGQIQTFLANNKDAQLLPSPGQMMPQFRLNGQVVTDNSAYDHDGFFLALLEKQAP